MKTLQTYHRNFKQAVKKQALYLQGRLNEIYNYDHNLRFRATNLLLTIVAANTVIVTLVVMFALASSNVIDMTTRMIFVPMFIALALLFIVCFKLVLKGKLSLSRAIVQGMANITVLGAITMTGGFPESMGSVALFIPVILSYCLYGGRASHLNAIILVTILAFQWGLADIFGVTFPNYASSAMPRVNIAIAILATFIIVWFALLVFDTSSRQHIQRADAAMVSKANFLSNTSHEIRTPMNGIIGLTEVMLRTTKLDQDQVIYMKAIHQSSTALMSIITDILDYSRLDGGHVELKAETFNLYTLIHEIRTLMTINAAEKNIIIRCDYAADAPQKFIGDAARIRQVIINLMANAVKFTENGHINIRSIISSNDHFSTIRVEIEDSGIGIPAHKLGSIFERFTQAESGTTQKYGGTGLGLSISQKLLELMGGNIGVTSQEHKGSMFWFELTLPLAETGNIDTIASGAPDIAKLEDTNTSSNVLALPSQNARQILIVSRTPALIQNYGSVLRRQGLRVFHTDSLSDIQKWVNGGAPQDQNLPVILVDGELPSLELSQAIALIQAENPDVQIVGINPLNSSGHPALSKLSMHVSTPMEISSFLSGAKLASP